MADQLAENRSDRGVMMSVATPAPASTQLTVELLRQAVEILGPMLAQPRLAEQLQEIRGALEELQRRDRGFESRLLQRRSVAKLTSGSAG